MDICKSYYSHSAHSHNNLIIFFGGETKYDFIHKSRNCSNSLFSFDCINKTWNLIESQNSPDPRRNFASTVIAEKFLMIYGGINTKGKFLNDSHFLNLGKNFTIRYNDLGKYKYRK